ncbi:hypothetical protein NPIL_30361 [Nephila pilipes]|uniref:Uncharacterized protein n=1 Tax=Nephila pilipes TaxID=299642 RepID=A0A8X6N4S4_NEPPI|nr:hypothetical protein NPIL_30361 [Nephila pilipes]
MVIFDLAAVKRKGTHLSFKRRYPQGNAVNGHPSIRKISLKSRWGFTAPKKFSHFHSLSGLTPQYISCVKKGNFTFRALRQAMLKTNEVCSNPYFTEDLYEIKWVNAKRLQSPQVVGK